MIDSIMNSRFKKLKKSTGKKGMYSEQELARIHEYEKMRTNRNGMTFSHVVLEFEFNQVCIRSLNTMLGNLLKKLRFTDHIGWENTNQIGIILPGTDEVGARHFIMNIEQIFAGASGIEIKLSATYPLPNSLMSTVSVSTNAEEEIAEAEEVSVLPFKLAW